MLKTIPLCEEYLEDAALLVSQRYQRLCEQEPHLPYRYAEVSNLIPLLQNILRTSGIGVAVFREQFMERLLL